MRIYTVHGRTIQIWTSRHLKA